jgi:ABC-type sugar transport system ATPase subunit
MPTGGTITKCSQILHEFPTSNKKLAMMIQQHDGYDHYENIRVV